MTGGVSATRAAGAWKLAVPPAPIAGAAGGLPRRVPGGVGPQVASVVASGQAAVLAVLPSQGTPSGFQEPSQETSLGLDGSTKNHRGRATLAWGT